MLPVKVLLCAGVGLACASAATAGAAADVAAAYAPEPALPAVIVTGDMPDAGRQASRRPDPASLHLAAPVDNGALGRRAAMDTPFSSTVVTAADLRERQARKLGDVFALDASVTDNGAAYGVWGSYLTVRGLPLDWQNAYRIDGNPFISYFTVLPYEQFERIDLLKGATGFMYGIGSPGGALNYVTRKPADEPVRGIDIGYRSKGLLQQHVDVGDRLGGSGAFGYRLNATHEGGNTYNDGRLNRNSLSLALDARLSDRLTWDFQTLQQDRDAHDQEPSLYTGAYTDHRLPRPLRNDDQSLNSKGQYADTRFRYYATGLKYALNPDWTFSTRYSHAETRWRSNQSILALADRAGDYLDFPSDQSQAYSYEQWRAMAEGTVRTGPVRHRVVLGAAWSKQKNDYSVNGTYFAGEGGNLYEQNRNVYYSDGSLDLYRAAEITQKSVFASDTMDLGGPWSVLAGVRYIDYDQRGFLPTGAQMSSYGRRGVPAPVFALMYRFSPRTMTYASYVEALQPGDMVGVLYSNYGTLLDPVKSRQYEVGIKTRQDDWTATAAVFRIDKEAEYIDGVNAMVRDGQARYQGVELAASTRLGRDWTVGGSLMALDAEYRQGTAYDGKRVTGAPRWSAAAQVAYAVPGVAGLSFRGVARYTGSTMLNASNELPVDGYVLFNVGATYEMRVNGYETTFRAGIDNVANKRYWMYQASNYVKAGDPRTFTLTASVKF
ncbi:TonB-dependent siderophore receptor [Bordetella sp. N]|uniref:TonB-dependent siderophore receptor n=1 Tax=Bordetella sp. N TaxID=1746199 RepID=UPI000711255F|nr:TonB-dependent receptor [Bordetella sp. N]ALM86244.1 ligand-gated channel protein [Bordetella sp. N]